MTIEVTRYQPIADKVAGKLAELLRAAVFVSDEQGFVIASTRSRSIGRPIDTVVREHDGPLLRTPFSLEHDRRSGEIVVAYSSREAGTSPRLTTALIEMVINQTLVAELSPTHTELKNKFIYDVLHGRIQDEEVILREGQILGMDFSQPRAVILIDASAYIRSPNGDQWGEISSSEHIQARQMARFVIQSVVGFFELPDDTICAHIGRGEIVVLKAVTAKTLEKWADSGARIDGRREQWIDLVALRRAASALRARLQNDTQAPISIGIGRYHAGIGGLVRSYNDARIALSVGSRFHGNGYIHSIDSLGISAFISGADEQTKLDLVSHLLNPLEDEPELLTTLTAFLDEGCCPSSTAARLSIHRNTLGYRLQKISALLGLDPREFDDAVQLRLALLLRSLLTGTNDESRR